MRSETARELKLINESPFDEHGDYKDNETPGFTETTNGNSSDELVNEPAPSNLSIEVNRTDILNQLRDMIADELVPAFRVFHVEGKIYEKDIDYRSAQATLRRSPRGHKEPVKEPKRKSKRRSKATAQNMPQTTYQSTRHLITIHSEKRIPCLLKNQETITDLTILLREMTLRWTQKS